MSLPYIGCTITLISKSEIRYVGKLVQIDQQQSTVTLQGVKSHGTEGRRAKSGLAEVLPSDQVFEYIVFRGSDIKDLHVSDLQAAQSKPIPPGLPDDPAIVSAPSSASSHVGKSVPMTSTVSSATAAASVSSPAPNGHVKAPVREAANKKFEPAGTHARPAGDGPLQSGRFMDATTQPTPGRGHGRGRSLRGRGRGRFEFTPVPRSDFDFETSNAKLDMGEIARQVAESHEAGGGTGYTSEDTAPLVQEMEGLSIARTYDRKTSFFDNISSDIKDRTEDRPTGVRRPADHRQINMETFGAQASWYRGGRGGGRGRGRYHRGGGRGRGEHRRPAQDRSNPTAPA